MPVTYSPVGDWGQSLATLGQALFPDPSKVAQARYYGAETRNALIKGDEGIAQQNMRNARASAVNLTGPGHFQLMHSQTGVSDAADYPTWVSDQPGSTGPTLGNTVSGQKTLPPPTITPADASNIVNHGTPPNPQGVGTAGTPAASSSPAPNSGAPPAPTTTASDGTTPANDAQSATLHPGSLQAPGGGVKYAPPAQANGSPAPVAVNLAQYTEMGAQAGYDAATLNSTGASFVAQAVKDGVLDKPTAIQIMLPATGVTAPLTAQTQITTTDMTNRTELAKQRMVTGEQAREFDYTPTLTTQTPGGAPVYAPRKQTFGGGTLAFDPNYNQTFNREVTVGDEQGRPVISTAGRQGLVGGGGVSTPGATSSSGGTTVNLGNTVTTGPGTGAGAATGGGVYAPDPKLYERSTTVGTYIDQRDGTLHSMTQQQYLDAVKTGNSNLVPAPANLAIPKDEIATRQGILDSHFNRAYPAPSVNVKEQAFLSPARPYPAANTRLLSLARNLELTSPDSTIRGNPDNAMDAAIQQGQSEGWLPSSEDAAEERKTWAGFGKLYEGQHLYQGQNAAGDRTQTYYRIDPPKKLSTTVTTPAPTQAKPPPTATTTTATTPPPQTQLPPGAITVAPAGAQDGQTGTFANGVKGVVRGGFVYPVTAAQSSPANPF